MRDFALFQRFMERVNLAVVIDHSGRAGNGFFLTLFDQHHEVLTCPWMHYTYSYILTEFGAKEVIEAEAAHTFWTRKSYFRYVYNDLDPELTAQIVRFGGSPDAMIDRRLVRKIFDAFVSRHQTVTRKELIGITYFAYARGVGRDLDRIRYILVSDSISLRFENVMNGFSGQVLRLITRDFPKPKLIHLVRDPRAGFASTCHQFINSLGNMYGIRFGNYLKRLLRLLRCDFDWDSVFVFGFWLLYFAQTFKAVQRQKNRYRNLFLTVKNEDLNLDFFNTMQTFCGKMGFECLDEWKQGTRYRPTMLGQPWQGTGAYNNRYQTNLYGPLRNDPPEVSSKITGPNIYVTRRWKSRMGKNEVKLVEILFREELSDLSYDFLYYREKKHEGLRFVSNLVLPLKGELPTLKWIKNGRHIGRKEVFQRLFYLASFTPFYILSRCVFAKFYFSGFFRNTEPAAKRN